MYVKLNSLFVSEMKVYYVTHVLKQGTYIKTMCPNYILEFRNMNPHLLQVLSRHVGQDRNCHRKSCLLYCC